MTRGSFIELRMRVNSALPMAHCISFGFLLSPRPRAGTPGGRRDRLWASCPWARHRRPGQRPGAAPYK
ncbi:hypothetical protein HMPREF9946_04633 [Acetobacteraceae bacterium AT-5844]|nr:hypothetical protein HMPREF9946_04633 [Acetobacteraceae bacterium AT-5844]